MNKLNFSRQDDRFKWKQLWKSILTNEGWHLSFFQVLEIKKWVLENELITNVHINFNGDFFNNGKYRWPSSLYNARLVVEEAKIYTNLYDLFISEPFDSNFNLHRSISSLCEQNQDLIEENISSDIIFSSNFYYTNQSSEEYFKSLNISTWSYDIVVISAICYLFENVYVKYHNSLKDFSNPNKKSVFYENPNYLELLKQDISLDINMLIREIAVYLIDKKYSKKLFYVLSNTNIFRIESFATLSAFTAIFDRLPKRQYIKYLKPNNSIVETLSRFFQVFQLNFIFCDSFIENEIQDSINNSNNSKYYSGNLLEILNIYKLFLQKYFHFRNDLKKLLSFNEGKLEIYNQKFFVNTFFHMYINDSLYIDINWAVKVFKKLFPSAQFDILPHLEQIKKNKKLKEKLSQIKNTIGFIGPILTVQSSFSGNSFKPPLPSVTSATSIGAVSSQEGVVRRSSVDVPASLQKRNYKAEGAQFKKYQQQNRNQYEAVFQQSQLSKRFTIIQENSSKLGEKNIQGLVFIEDQETGLLTPIGNVGSYDALTTALTNLTNSKTGFAHNANTLRKAHFFYEKMRKTCGVSREDGLSWLVPSCINQIEEHPSNQENRDYRYQSKFTNISLPELIFDNTVKSWGYIFQTVASDSSLESRALLESDTLDFLNRSFKKNVGNGIAQLDQRRISLQIPENKSLFYLYSGDVLQKLEQLTDTIKPYALHTAGNGRTLRVPGNILSEACNTVYVLTQIGKTYIEELGSPIAKQVFSNLLRTQINSFCDEVNNAAIANISYLEAGRQNIPELIISFDEIPIFDVCNPDINQILEVVDQINNILQKQHAGDLQKALETGREFGIGDFRNGNKARIIQTGDREPHENFKHIEPPQAIYDYTDDSRWIC